MNISFKISDKTKEKMIEYFKDKKRLKTPPYAIFQADEEDTVVTLYESGKVLFQGMSADIDAAMWREMEKHLNPSKNLEVKTKDTEKKKNNKVIKNVYYTSAIGSDEVGTGDYFGPVVVTAAYVDIKDIEFLENIGVADSKKLTDNKILEIVPLFINKIKHSTIILNNKDYNKYYNDDFNLNKIKAVLHNRALLILKKQVQNYDYIIVDQFTTPNSYFKYLINAPSVVRDITFYTKAEDIHLSVACGSLISRFYFIQEMDKLSKELNIILPYGAGAQITEIGQEIIEKFGEKKLEEVAKLNFKNTEHIKKDAI
ncbi:MAG TPA: ribonuclease HIII [Patescibacteria group bacterium]|nr:ribonuclease HIII [Patescibacteria group bacterium]